VRKDLRGSWAPLTFVGIALFITFQRPPSKFFILYAGQVLFGAGRSHLSCCDLNEIEIGIEIEKVWDLDPDPDPDPDFDFDFDFEKTFCMRSPFCLGCSIPENAI
jgi:hypothetical protein